MKRRLSLFLLLALSLAFLPSANAQRWKTIRYEVIGGVGTTNVFGDIGGGATRENLMGLRDLQFDQTRPSFVFGLRYRMYEKHAIRLNFGYGNAYGTDEGAVNDVRNYSFTSHLFEQSLVYEYYLITEEIKKRSSAMYNRKGMLNNYSKLAIYGFTGLGFVEAITNVDTKGRKPPVSYLSKGTAGIVFPIGVGAKLILDQHSSVSLELGGRYSLNDRLDGYKSRGSQFNDIYYFTTLNYSYRLKNTRYGVPSFLDSWYRTSWLRKFIQKTF